MYALGLTPRAEQVAKGVRAVSKAYDGAIADTEFCISSRYAVVRAGAPKPAGMKNWPCIPPSSCAAAKWSPGRRCRRDIADRRGFPWRRTG